MGTISNNELVYRRVGANLEIRGTFDAGTVTTSEAQIELPDSLTIDTGSSISIAGFIVRSNSSNTKGGIVLATSGDTFLNFTTYGVFGSDTLSALAPANGDTASATGETISILISVPISGWDAVSQLIAAVPVEQVQYFEYNTSGSRHTVTTSETQVTLKDSHSD